MLLHFAARAEHVARTIRPALAAGMTVVCDRFTDSTMAYQGYGQGADRVQIDLLIGLVGLKPDLTYILDLPEQFATERMVARGTMPDRYDRLGQGFHARVAEGFRAIAASAPNRCRLIDASSSQGNVFEALSVSLSRALQDRPGASATRLEAGKNQQ